MFLSNAEEVYLLNLKVTDNIIDLDSEEEMLLNKIVQQYVNRITESAAVSLIETAVIFTAAFNIQFAAHLRTLPRGQQFNMFPCKHRSINSTKIPITYPAASTTKIGATVTMPTSIVDGCLSGFFEANNGLNILS